MKKSTFLDRIPVIAVIVLMLTLVLSVRNGGGQVAKSACETMGWFPSDIGLKDHHLFFFKGYYYLVSNLVGSEDRFAYARSQDFCAWETLPTILGPSTHGLWDEMAVWAPFVYEEDEVYYLYYTGVTRKFTQSIMAATTSNPKDPTSWQAQGMIFQPDHPGMLWEAGQWADARDPTVIKTGGIYYLYYTGRDISGGIIGMATAPSPLGPWRDWGSIIPAVASGMLESPTLARFDGTYYLFYHHTGRGEYFRAGSSPGGPWGDPQPIRPGLAHEVWQDRTDEWFTSYLTDYSVTISPLTWDTFFSPAQPWIGDDVYHQIMPVVRLEKLNPPALQVENSIFMWQETIGDLWDDAAGNPAADPTADPMGDPMGQPLGGVPYP